MVDANRIFCCRHIVLYQFNMSIEDHASGKTVDPLLKAKEGFLFEFLDCPFEPPVKWHSQFG